jgi:3-hydroxymyristoyl/3-hydroxydecanoyl-(acyl carrier protein) dehydratase
MPGYAAPLEAVDEVTVAQRDGRLVVSASKDVTVTGPYLEAHFPGRTVYPGVFILETVCQAVATALGERDGRLPELTAVTSMRFVGAVHPGDRLLVEATIEEGPIEEGPIEEGPIEEGTAGAPLRVAAQCWRTEVGAEVARLALEFGYLAGADA